MAKIHKLSAAAVKAQKKPGRYGDGGGLWLQVSKGVDENDPPKSWLFRFMIRGKAFEMGLGSLDTFTLSEVRDEAMKLRKLVARKENPLHLRREEEARKLSAESGKMTFEVAAERYIKSKQSEWKNEKHRDQWSSTIKTYAYPVIGKLDVSKVDTGHILKIIEPIWTTKTETATRLRGRLEKVLDWAAFAKARTGENPARWRGHLEAQLPRPSKVTKPKNHPAMPYAAMPAFMGALRQRDSISARALEFAILTAARTGETIGARWEEIDLDAKVWTVPADRMKAGKEQRVPLSPRAIEILKGLPSEGGFIFPGAKKDKPLSNMAMLELMRGMDGAAGLTVHGFRSSFRDWAGETTAHPREVIEHALAHQLADKAEAAYQRGDLLAKRSRLMIDWAKYCSLDGAKGNVTLLKSVN